MGASLNITNDTTVDTTITVQPKQCPINFAKIKAWGGRSYSWFQSQVQHQNRAFVALVLADLVFLKIAFKITQLVFGYFPKPDTLRKKIVRDVSLLGIYVLTFSTMHYSFFKGMNLALSPSVAKVTGLSTFILGNFFYLKYKDRLKNDLKLKK